MKLYRIEQKEEEIEILYVYLFFKDPKNKHVFVIDKYQDLNAILVFFSTAYILKFIFFG